MIPPGVILCGLAVIRMLVWWSLLNVWEPDPAGRFLPGIIAGIILGELTAWLVLRLVHVGISPWTLPLELLAAGGCALLAVPYLPLSGTGSIALVLPAFLMSGALSAAAWRLMMPEP